MFRATQRIVSPRNELCLDKAQLIPAAACSAHSIGKNRIDQADRNRHDFPLQVHICSRTLRLTVKPAAVSSIAQIPTKCPMATLPANTPRRRVQPAKATLLWFDRRAAQCYAFTCVAREASEHCLPISGKTMDPNETRSTAAESQPEPDSRLPAPQWIQRQSAGPRGQGSFAVQNNDGQDRLHIGVNGHALWTREPRAGAVRLARCNVLLSSIAASP